LQLQYDLHGGEGGIRTHERPLESVTSRFLVAASAMIARSAVAHCPPLPTAAVAEYGGMRRLAPPYTAPFRLIRIGCEVP